jgi:hypothetical protein
VTDGGPTPPEPPEYPIIFLCRVFGSVADLALIRAIDRTVDFSASRFSDREFPSYDLNK